MVGLKEIGVFLALVLIVIPSVVTSIWYLPQMTSGSTEERTGALSEYLQKMVVPWWVKPLEWASEKPGLFGTLLVLSILAIVALIYRSTGVEF